MARRRTVTEKSIRAPWWDAHETVLIQSIRERENQDIQDQLAAMTAGQDNSDMKLALGTTRRLTLLHGIKAWTLTEADGKPLPLSLSSIVDLFPEDADFIYAELNKINQRMGEDEKKAS